MSHNDFEEINLRKIKLQGLCWWVALLLVGGFEEQCSSQQIPRKQQILRTFSVISPLHALTTGGELWVSSQTISKYFRFRSMNQIFHLCFHIFHRKLDTMMIELLEQQSSQQIPKKQQILRKFSVISPLHALTTGGELLVSSQMISKYFRFRSMNQIISHLCFHTFYRKLDTLMVSLGL